MAKNKLRIIGGSWRGRKLDFPDLPGLRPTPDRVRETLFNWLQTDIADAVCLDLFAGSGALGLEALSRGAEHVVFVDAHPKAIEKIKQNADVLNVNQAEFYVTKADVYLEKYSNKKKFDVVFLDPPFHENLLFSSLLALQSASVVGMTSRVYVEAEKALDESALPEDWLVSKAKTAGKVYYYLLSLQDKN